MLIYFSKSEISKMVTIQFKQFNLKKWTEDWVSRKSGIRLDSKKQSGAPLVLETFEHCLITDLIKNPYNLFPSDICSD